MNKGKSLYLGNDARQGLSTGIKKLSAAVKSTLGPGGRTVVIAKEHSSPIVTKDGVTVAKEIYLQDELENMGAQILKEVSSKTAHEAGDGTTTATVLAEAILNNVEEVKESNPEFNVIDIKKGIDAATSNIVKQIESAALKIDVNDAAIKQVATISANNDESIGDLIANAFRIVGKNGIITVEEARGTETELITVEGMEIDKGYLSPYFSTNNEKMTCELEKPFVLIYEKSISSIHELAPVVELAISEGRPLAIVAENVDGEALATLVVNRVRAGLKVVAVKAPSFGDRRKEILKDLAILTGGEVISPDLGMKLESVTIDQLGECEKVIVSKDSSVFVDGAGSQESIQGRVAQIEAAIQLTSSDFEKEKLLERLAKISNGIAIIRVGAVSEIEMKEKKDRIDDAVHATRAALEEGIIPGGGLLLHCSATSTIQPDNTKSTAFTAGYYALVSACKEPMLQILSNYGYSNNREELIAIANKIVRKVIRLQEGKETAVYDISNKGEIADMLQLGVIDPAKVTRCALQNAASVASTVITSEAVVGPAIKTTENHKED